MTPRNLGSDRRFSVSNLFAGMDRRALLAGASQAAAAAALLPAMRVTRALAADAPIAETTSGKIRCVAVDGVNAFKGVPYGAPTGGRARFMAPRKPEPWAGVRSAEAWAGHAPQSPPDRKQRPELAGLAGARDTVPESEDCLTLNVFTRGIGDGGKRPVMVWYHGGGIGYGSSNTPEARGSRPPAHHHARLFTLTHPPYSTGHVHRPHRGSPRL